MLTNEKYNGLFALTHSDITLSPDRFFSEKPKQLHQREVRKRERPHSSTATYGQGEDRRGSVHYQEEPHSHSFPHQRPWS
ncbi:unnamed protein product [Prunus armeniaca]|uniref:Uncharacterized protein n=1 Tax=Prunus armeniaca TaxID=36596 RepID=A0A6J5TYR9_PRUAR|nr:unnamed protein product [Prunus armeniaca]